MPSDHLLVQNTDHKVLQRPFRICAQALPWLNSHSPGGPCRTESRLADTPTPLNEALEDDELLGDEPESDVLFRARMGAINFALGYWKMGVGALGGVLLVSLVYGLWTSHIQSTQRGYQAAVAAAFEPVQEAFQEPDEAARTASLTAIAKDVEAAAAAAEGPGAAYGWIRAAQMWEELDDDAAALAAWKAGHAVKAPGIVGWTCGIGYATALAESGDLAGAAPVLRQLAATHPGSEGAEAMAQLASLYIDAKQDAEARSVLQEIQTKWPDNLRAAELSVRLGAG